MADEGVEWVGSLPSIIGIERVGMEWFCWRAPWDECDEPASDEDFDCAPYIHRDAARAWAGFAMWCMCSRAFDFDMAYNGGYLCGHSDAVAWQHFIDWLNGSVEQWAQREADAYAEGENDGFDRGLRLAPRDCRRACNHPGVAAMTDQTDNAQAPAREGESEYAELRERARRAIARTTYGDLNFVAVVIADQSAAIRALEAKERESEAQHARDDEHYAASQTCSEKHRQNWVDACQQRDHVRAQLDSIHAMHANLRDEYIAACDERNALRAALAKEREKVESLRDALQLLKDHQNGCPLPKYEAQWSKAMADATALLSGRGEVSGG